MSQDPDQDEECAPAVRLRGVRKRFGYHDVLKAVHLEVPRGSVFVLSGPNGAGKSTLLRIVATQWTFASGQVEVLGLDARRQYLEIRSRIGAVFHESFLRQELSLEENLQFAASLYGLKWPVVEDHATDLVKRFDLSKRRRDAVGTFSQGMTKRANLIRSLLHRPALWILDEPFSGLDVDGHGILTNMIRDFARQGTVLLVTHQAALGKEVATDEVSLVDGRVDQNGGDTREAERAEKDAGGGETTVSAESRS